jgi:hypothetical protein
VGVEVSFRAHVAVDDLYCTGGGDVNYPGHGTFCSVGLANAEDPEVFTWYSGLSFCPTCIPPMSTVNGSFDFVLPGGDYIASVSIGVWNAIPPAFTADLSVEMWGVEPG